MHIRDLVKDEDVIVKYCKTLDQVVDIITKAVKFLNYIYLLNSQSEESIHVLIFNNIIDFF